MTLINRQWQLVQGTTHLRIYPCIRKPDVISSNTFLLETAEQITVIDPGADEEHTCEIEIIIRELYRKKNRPVLIFLTHCHLDHAYHIPRYLAMRDQIPVWIAVHHDAENAVSTGDCKLTVSELYSLEFPCFSPDISLLPPHIRDISPKPREIHLSDNTRIPVETTCLETAGNAPLFRKSLPLGCGEILEWFAMPGHTPDSVCIKVGELLFIGDILSAINPIINTISGWSRSDYINSATNLIWLLEQNRVAWCLPGHGGILSASQVIVIIKKARSKAEKLADSIAIIDADRLRYTSAYAQELLIEAEEVFATIAGRLYYLAHYLEILEEDELAEHFRQSLDADKIDDCLLNLRRLADDYAAGKKLEVDFAIRALDVIQKIRNLFDSSKISAVIPRNLLNRANLLLLDFINSANGRRNFEDSVIVDINRFMEDFLQELKTSKYDDLTILDTTENQDQFLTALASRIAYLPLFETVKITFTPCKTIPSVSIAASRFGDTLTDILCALRAGDTHQEIHMFSDYRNNFAEIEIFCPRNSIRQTIGESKWNSFYRRFMMCGMELSMQGERLNLRLSEQS